MGVFLQRCSIGGWGWGCKRGEVHWGWGWGWWCKGGRLGVQRVEGVDVFLQRWSMQRCGAMQLSMQIGSMVTLDCFT